ncbi:hypothetical protein FACS1894211_00740 [Clostridia bacterium]|nr:hypothetical protein FACS1894211_00740 [Clostridia bacterium]
MTEAFKRLKEFSPLFKTITFDNGSEFAKVKYIKGFRSYFAHPSSLNSVHKLDRSGYKAINDIDSLSDFAVFLLRRGYFYPFDQLV